MTSTDEELCMFALLKAAAAIEARLEDALGSAGLSLPKLGVLSQLAEAGEPLPLSELAGRLSCVRSNMTQLMDRLEAEGWTMNHEGGNKLKVRQPGHSKPYKRPTV